LSIVAITTDDVADVAELPAVVQPDVVADRSPATQGQSGGVAAPVASPVADDPETCSYPLLGSVDRC
jgi:hypothetical protein